MAFQEIQVTTPAVYRLTALPADNRRVTMYVRGTSLGVGVLTAGYITAANTFQAFDSTFVPVLALGLQVSFEPGPGVELAVELVGGTGGVGLFVATT